MQWCWISTRYWQSSDIGYREGRKWYRNISSFMLMLVSLHYSIQPIKIILNTTQNLEQVEQRGHFSFVTGTGITKPNKRYEQ